MPPYIYDGSGLDLPVRFPLRSGALTMLFDDGALRYISLGDVELMREVYFAVRDENWGTIPATMTIQEKLVDDDHFRIVFERVHEERHIRFRWTGTLEGSRDGVITMTVDGSTETTFQRNRIGWCVIHSHKAAGVRAKIEHVDGTESEGRFPDKIQPDQPFFDVRVIRHEAAPDLWFRTEMTGETFETEDQRNYTDASFKTYSTPQRLPKPVTLETGTPIRQTVTMSLVTPRTAEDAQTPYPLLVFGTPLEPSAEVALRVTLDPSHAHPLPSIGLTAIPTTDPLADEQISLLKALNLGYVRGEVWLNQPDAAQRLNRAADDANRLGEPLAIAAFLGDNAEQDADALVTLLDSLRPQPELAPITIYLSGGNNGNGAKIRLVKERLSRFGVPIGVGADRFNTLNNNRPPADVVDFLSYGASPQVHAIDHLTHLETLWGQNVQLESALILSRGKPIHVGPVTFRGFAGWQPIIEDSSALDPMPWYVDPRQMSLFGAGWTIGSISALAAGGASMVTYYGTVGMTGVVAHDSGVLPDAFGDLNGVFPMWHVFKWVGDFAGGEAVAVTLNDPLVGTALALRKAGKNRLLIANSADHSRTVKAHLPGQSSVMVKILDESTADPAMQVPDAFQSAAGTSRSLEDGILQLDLAPYAIVCVDWNS